jgi:hypothetical protein
MYPICTQFTRILPVTSLARFRPFESMPSISVFDFSILHATVLPSTLAARAFSAVIWKFVKRVGMAMLQGSSLTKVAMPVELSQPVTYLQHVAGMLCFVPHYLHQAAKSRDPVERMKYAITAVLAGLHRCVPL